MKQVWSIFLQDLRNIKRVPLMGLLLVGLAVLPSLYAWFNLSASWDPYSNTGDIRIAIVNEDKGAALDGKSINVGNQLVENLQDNHDLGWEFVPKEEAERGVRYGTYYASIYIDEKFSEDLVRVIDGEPQSAEIHYQVNEKLNAIAPKMTSAGASSIVNKVSDQIIAEASKALFTEFNKIGLKLEEELPTIRRLENKIFELEKRFPEINRFAETIIKIDSDWGELQKKAEKFLELKEIIPKINAGAEQILLLEERLPQINTLANKIVELEKALPSIEAAAEGISGVDERFTAIYDQLGEALNGIKTAQAAIDRAQQALPTITETAESTAAYVEALSLFVDQAQGAAQPILNIVMEQIAYAEHTAASIDAALERLQQSESPEQILSILEKLNPRLSSGISTLERAINMFEALNQYVPNGRLQPVIDRLTTTKAKMESLHQGISTVIKAGNIAENKIPELRGKAQAAEQAASELNRYLSNGGAKAIVDALSLIDKKAEGASTLLTEVQQNLPNVENILKNAEEITILGEERLNELIETFPQIEARIHELTERIEEELPRIVAAIHEASSFVQKDLPTIEEKVHKLSDFIRNDLKKIEDEYKKLSGLMEEHLPQIEKAVHDLADFAKHQLPDLENKVGNVADQMRKFEREHDLSELISLLKNDIEKESEFFANPVLLKEEKLFPIPNYGSANAPFYTALCLWVGALLLSNLLSTNLHPVDIREDYKAHHMYFGRMILFLIIGILQALIVSTGNFLLLDAYAAHPFWYVLFTVVIAIVFMTIVYTLASVFGNIGKALAVILMVLQLSGAGGTFPIQVAPPFFQAINPFLPFTYAINLLREAVGGIIPAIAWKYVAILVGIWVIAILFGLLLKKPLAARINKTAEKSKSSRLME